jgi:hypothetical protein
MRGTPGLYGSVAGDRRILSLVIIYGSSAVVWWYVITPGVGPSGHASTVDKKAHSDPS